MRTEAGQLAGSAARESVHRVWTPERIELMEKGWPQTVVVVPHLGHMRQVVRDRREIRNERPLVNVFLLVF